MTDNSADTGGDTSNDAYSAAERFKRVEKMVERPNLLLGGLKIEEEKRKEAEVKACIKLGMNWEQILRMLLARGYSASRTSVYNLINKVGTPRNYRPSKHAQTHHDLFILEMVVRLAEDALPRRIRGIQKGKSPEKGAGFRYDFFLKMNGHTYYGEMQLSDLAGTDWARKMKYYVNWYEKKTRLKEPFRVLFVIDQKGDISGIRAKARELLESTGHPNLNLFLFLPLDELKSARTNLVYDEVWYTKDGNRIPLLQSKR